MHQDSQSRTQSPRLGVYLTLIVISMALTGCPPKTLSQSQIVDTRITELVASNIVYKANTLANVLSAGQWLQYKSIDENSEPSIVTYKLIASDGFNHTIELVEEDYHGSIATYMELRYDPGRDAKSLKVKRVLTRYGQSTPKESSPEDLAIKESYYRALASQLFVPWVEGPMDGDVSVGAGQFQGCHKIETSLSVAGLVFRANSWHHPALPMQGMVKAERTDGTEGVMELVDFGLEGALSDVLRAVR